MDEARQFVAAIVRHDPEGLARPLSPTVDFKGLTPGRLWEASSPQGVVDVVLGHWFGEKDRIVELLGVVEDEVADTRRIGYRFALENPDGAHVAEQQAYYRTGPDGIGHLRIMCSGYRPRTL
ncbi:hypothetical protein [Nocardioides coralli]|uniref:hypothetical protein n=1 Tax=Nocardioides coralli TaxID=2872154 RepID=UPI001CA3D6B2|nr:hypothetical protein [Nocardioides coralli]QZY29546.1 hypothetical protein K6T13_02290 [Nocardioides coralli]